MVAAAVGDAGVCSEQLDRSHLCLCYLVSAWGWRCSLAVQRLRKESRQALQQNPRQLTAPVRRCGGIGGQTSTLVLGAMTLTSGATSFVAFRTSYLIAAGMCLLELLRSLLDIVVAKQSEQNVALLSPL